LPAYFLIDPAILASIGVTFELMPILLLNPVWVAIYGALLIASYQAGQQKFKETVEQQVVVSLPSELARLGAEQGVTITNVRDISVTASYEIVGTQFIIIPLLVLNVQVECLCDSDKPFIESPVADWVMTIITWILIAVVATILGIVIVLAIREWLQSMTTETWTVETHQPDCTWKKESGTKPAETGILAVFIGIAAVIGIVIAVATVAPSIRDWMRERA